MSTQTVGLDRAVEYLDKLEKFRLAVQSQHLAAVQNGYTVEVETGRKFDKVYINTGHQNMGRYMVDRNTWNIYGVKSWAQVNPRRWFGTLSMVDQWDWSGYTGVPKPGTDAEKALEDFENEWKQQYRPRGRPRKNP